MLKRLFDIVLALVGLLLFAPAAALCVALIQLDSRGPALHRSPRYGRFGRPFNLLRLRTKDANGKRGRFGYLVGNLSFDEYPTLWNVLKGEISIIGPRPNKLHEIDPADAGWREVLSVKPGTLSLSVLTFRARFNQTDNASRLERDLHYVRQRSLRYDARLLLRGLTLWLRMGHIKGKIA